MLTEEKRAIQFYSHRLTQDWFWILICLVFGAMVVQLAGSTASWKSFTDEKNGLMTLGKVKRSSGLVRMIHSRSTTWEDISLTHSNRSVRILEKDRLSTGHDGRVLALMDDSTHLELEPETLIEFSSPSVKIEQGNLIASLKKRDSSFQFLLKDRILRLTSLENDTSVHIQIRSPHSLTITPLRGATVNLTLPSKQGPIQKLTSARRWVIELGRDTEDFRILPGEIAPPMIESPEEHHSVKPIVPHILGPTHGARFVSNANEKLEVTLNWELLPLSLQPEIEIRRFDDPEFKPILDMTQAGAIATLPDGTYLWRVRTRHAQEEHIEFSDWTSLREFSIQENAHSFKSVVLLESEKADQANARIRMAKEMEEARQREIHEQRLSLSPSHQSPTRKIAGVSSHPQKKHSSSNVRLTQEETNYHRQKLETKYRAIAAASKERIELSSEGAQELTGQSHASVQVDQSNGVSSLQVRFQWKRVPYAEGYSVTLFENQTKKADYSSTSPEIELPFEVFESQKEYSYQVSTTNKQGQIVKGPLISLRIEIETPFLSEPEDYFETSRHQTVRFNWTNSYPMDEYHFQMARDFDFTHLFYDNVSKDRYLILPVEAPGSIYWRVQAVIRGFRSPWSELRQVRIN